MSIQIKPWGEDIFLYENEVFSIRLLKIKKGHAVSLHYHTRKHEALYVIKGSAEYYLLSEGIETIRIIKAGDLIYHKPYEIHRQRALEEFHILEISTLDINDIVRIEDDYGRQLKSE